jgi:hypothetical protein
MLVAAYELVQAGMLVPTRELVKACMFALNMTLEFFTSLEAFPVMALAGWNRAV